MNIQTIKKEVMNIKNNSLKKEVLECFIFEVEEEKGNTIESVQKDWNNHKNCLGNLVYQWEFLSDNSKIGNFFAENFHHFRNLETEKKIYDFRFLADYLGYCFICILNKYLLQK